LVIIIIAVLVAIALPRYFAAIYMARVRACQANMKIINLAASTYFAQNKEWPDEVSDMLSPEVAGVTTPATMKGGQLTEVPICPFDVDGNHPYEMVPVYEDPGDTGTPVVGYVVNWDGHFDNASWQSATTHKP
jgi:type II secretory pathway pseudopilin PulG